MSLCVIPGCRLLGRHLPGCDTCPVNCECHNGPHYACSEPGGCGSVGCGRREDCKGCLPRVAEEGLVCAPCLGRWAAKLEAIADLTPDARAVAAGLVRRGSGGYAGKPQSRPPLNDGATDVMDSIQNALTTMARDIAETRGLHFVSAAFEGHRVADPLVEASSWLTGQLGWLGHAVDEQGEPRAGHAFAEIAECVRRIRSLVDPSEGPKFLGPCGAPLIAIDPEVAAEQGIHPDNAARGLAPCDGDVYGYPGAQFGVCRLCEAKVDQAERRAWLDDEVRLHAYTRRDISDAYGIKPNTITVWWKRGRLPAYWVTGTGLHVAWVELEPDPALKGEALAAREREIEVEHKARGPKHFYLGDVLDLAAQEAARREERRADRERRTQAKEKAA